MCSSSQKVIKVVALLLVWFVSQVYVHGNLVKSGATMNGASSDRARRTDLAGSLATARNKPITINGNKVGAGTTILSGTQLQTPSEVGASVQLPSLGRLDIAPNTSMRLTFDKSSIDVDLTSGCVILTTYEGISGSVKPPPGLVGRTDPSRRHFVDVCTGGPGAAPVIGKGAAISAGAGVCNTSMAPAGDDSGWFNGKSLLAFAAGAAALVGSVHAATTGSDNTFRPNSENSNFRGSDTSR